MLLEESCRGSKSESEGPWLELDARCKIKESFLDAWRFPKILADRTVVAVCTGEDEDILVQLLVTSETVELALQKFPLFGNSVECKLSHVCQKTNFNYVSCQSDVVASRLASRSCLFEFVLLRLGIG